MEEWERLLDELRAELTLREQELELLHDIDLRLLADEPVHEEIFDFIVRRTQKLLRANHAQILLRRSTFLEPMYCNLKSVVGQRVPISTSLTGECLVSDRTFNVADVLEAPYSLKYAPLRGYRGTPMRSLLATPIRINDTPIGVLNAESKTPGVFKAVHERIIAAIAAQIAIALQRAQVLQGSILLADVDRMMFDTEDSQQVIQTALERVMSELQRLEHVQHTGAQITFLRGQNQLEIVHSTNPRDVGLILPVDKSVSGRAARERKTVIIGDVSSDPEYKRMLGDSIRSEIAVPILFGEDNIVLGVLNVESEEEDAFYGFYQVVLESFAEKVRTLLAFARLRADVTEILEMRSADDLLVAVGDQTSHLIHRLNNTVGAMRMRILELQDLDNEGRLGKSFLTSSLEGLRELAERTLRMPDDISRLLGQGAVKVEINECVSKAADEVERPSSVRLTRDLGEDIPALPLYCFDIVVQNLIQNAVDAMPQGGHLHVSTAIIQPQGLSTGYFQLQVQDTGVGIPADIQKKIFELNFTTKRARGRGMGLGLWWVRNFVRRAGGDITIRSAPGSGTEVTVKIPLDRRSKMGSEI
jgi:signal transduction histidine kinase